MFNNDNQAYFEDHYYTDDSFQDNPTDYDAEDQFFLAQELPTEFNPLYCPLIQELHTSSSAAPSAQNDTQHDQFFAMEDVKTYDDSDAYTPNN